MTGEHLSSEPRLVVLGESSRPSTPEGSDTVENGDQSALEGRSNILYHVRVELSPQYVANI